MMSQAFYTGLTGLRSSSQSINIISDNLANTSTIGFRGNNAEFSSLFERAINTDSGTSLADNTIGVGTTINATTMNEAQGTLQLSNRDTDLAIEGKGWFGVQSYGQTIYTRDGAFNFDSNRDLVNNDGAFVLGTMGKNISKGVLTKQLSSIPLADVTGQEKLAFPKELYFPPTPTSKATFSGNLSLNENIVAVSAPVTTSDGVNNSLRLEFTKVTPSVGEGVSWNIVATTQSKDGSVIYDTKNGVANFDAAGALISNTLTTIDNQGSAVAINIGSGNDGIVSMNAINSLTSSSDGKVAGTLLGYNINKNGEILATFTNGKQSNVGSIAIFHFQNDQGLERLNGSKFLASSNSGKPLLYKDANGNNINGVNLITNKLESSNVDYTVGLTDLIIMQRAYDANSKSISTADQMIQKALSMNK
jgi:flagellar hook protein FlgE